MKEIVAGIVAHVDAGKTTLSEAMLYQTGALRKLGRVDNGDAFLDPDALEKKRGITIFSHQASVQFNDLKLTLLDTPGHVDFAAQTEQVLSVLDYAILVISATDGIQGYTRTLWDLLAHYQVPTFIFVNKMDAAGADQQQVLTQVQKELTANCVAFNAYSGNDDLTTEISAANYEEIGLCDEAALDELMRTGAISDETVQILIRQRKLFPVYFGSALKLHGVETLLAGLERWSKAATPTTDFAARVFKISHTDKDERLTWVRVLGGVMHTKDVLLAEQKVNAIRIYNGAKFTTASEIQAGGVAAVTGLTTSYPGQGLGAATNNTPPMIQPVLNYALDPQGEEIQACLAALRQLEDEDPQLHVTWLKNIQELHVQIMGQVQLEILQQLLADRYHLMVGFGKGHVLYKETITAAVEGVGHFEPLRHYSEVHLLMTPAPANSGLTFASDCSLEMLGRNWQHQILTSLQAKEHLGVLIGAPITDMKVTLISGRASIVHTVGGDFREATWRAVRQGLMMLKATNHCQLLEPWYRFRLTVDQNQVGRAMNDIQRMHGELDMSTSETTNTTPTALMTTLTGTAPVEQMQAYAQDVQAYTHGLGQLECVVAGYRPCHNAAAIVAATQYDPVTDLDNVPGSVFCAHGAGYLVQWDQVPQTAHVPYTYSHK
ncbi:elongation factor G [Lapidilactobacillus bayanensis]|uniref:elongation factor G n=1 Tax=Lapidilactobacillus bayanensis TaxID=2485998 RepID=UPI000F798439|nr:TetM/TetW/TetO/TetS family tetracycline resistance ribosomal protection protein [Lapidilactobacillus bayanensis]